MIKLFLIFICFFCLQGFAATPEMTAELSGYINEVIDGNTLILDGKKVQLAGIDAPKKDRLADEAIKKLSSLMEGHKATLWFNKIKKDRYGRFTGHLIRDDGKWIQKEMLLSGMARVFNIVDNRNFAKEMLNAEKTARNKGKGIWKEKKYTILTKEQTEQHIESFQIIEAKVFSVKKTKNNIWINFGKNWRTDFTVMADKKVISMFKKNLEPIKGQLIRVRGWIEEYNGSMIKLTCPEQIEYVR